MKIKKAHIIFLLLSNCLGFCCIGSNHKSTGLETSDSDSIQITEEQKDSIDPNKNKFSATFKLLFEDRDYLKPKLLAFESERYNEPILIKNYEKLYYRQFKVRKDYTIYKKKTLVCRSSDMNMIATSIIPRYYKFSNWSEIQMDTLDKNFYENLEVFGWMDVAMLKQGKTELFKQNEDAIDSQVKKHLQKGILSCYWVEDTLKYVEYFDKRFEPARSNKTIYIEFTAVNEYVYLQKCPSLVYSESYPIRSSNQPLLLNVEYEGYLFKEGKLKGTIDRTSRTFNEAIDTQTLKEGRDLYDNYYEPLVAFITKQHKKN